VKERRECEKALERAPKERNAILQCQCPVSCLPVQDRPCLTKKPFQPPCHPWQKERRDTDQPAVHRLPLDGTGLGQLPRDSLPAPLLAELQLLLHLGKGALSDQGPQRCHVPRGQGLVDAQIDGGDVLEEERVAVARDGPHHLPKGQTSIAVNLDTRICFDTSDCRISLWPAPLFCGKYCQPQSVVCTCQQTCVQERDPRVDFSTQGFPARSLRPPLNPSD
jgi:hypothetical protein